MKHEPFNESAEMYLKTVRDLAQGGKVVPISTLAQNLGVSAVSATEMVHRLQEQGLLNHIPYKGIQLTTDGDRRALEIKRNHQLWECFLSDQLGLPWHMVHDYACRLEHATDERVTEALDAFLGHPRYCPHGNPIPDARGQVPAQDNVPLNALEAGRAATVQAVHPESTALLTYLTELGIRPGQEVVLQEIAPFDGPLMVRVGDQVHGLGHEVAGQIFVAAHSVGEASSAATPEAQSTGTVTG